MLKSIVIRGFRSCRDVSLTDLPSLVALIGRNAAGKTNILRAIEWVARLASGGLHEELLWRHVTPFEQGPRVSVVIEERKKSFLYELKFSFTSPSDEPGILLELEESVSVRENGQPYKRYADEKEGK